LFTKFLGLTFHSNTSWIAHIKILKTKCLNSLNIIEYLFHPRTGCNRSLLLQIYNSLIRSQLDYRAPIYSHTNKTTLKLLDSIQSATLRLALGALHTSPTLSLCAEAGVHPLQFRFLSLIANFLASTAQFPQIPIFLPLSLCPQNSFRFSLEDYLGKHLRLELFPPIYSSFPPWTLAPLVIRLDLAVLRRSPNSMYLKHIKAIIVNEFSSHTLCYTDGSKSGTRTGYAFSISGVITQYRLRNCASLFSAELLAIYSCLSYLSLLPPPHKFFLLFDSFSSLQAMQDPHSPNPIVQRILILLHSLSSSSSSCAFLWIPGHIDLPDHDEVDFAAEQSLLFDPSLSPAYDFKTYYRFFITSSWHNTWRTQPLTKLRSIKKAPTPWSSSNPTSHHEEIIISRLRIGYTRLIHSYLLLELYSPPSCRCCHADEITVPHFFSCPSLQNLRISFSVPSLLSSALSDDSETITNTLNFLRSTYFFKSI